MKYKNLFFSLLFYSLLFSQHTYTISGFVRDASSGEELIGADVYIESLNIGGSTNLYGFYSLTLQEGEYELTYNYIGYRVKKIKVNLRNNLRKDIELPPFLLSTDSVTVYADAPDKNVKSVEMSTIELDPSKLKPIPVLLGEQDVLKTIQLLPGVSGAREGSTGFHVRGGNTDENLVLLDEAPVFNPSHLLGFFSVFNSEAIKDVNLMKGSAPAKYGGRLSSVLDVKMKEGNLKKYSLFGGIGLISSRLTVEGPIVKDKGSFIVSARRTYADLFLAFSSDEKQRDASLYFYDLNLKTNYHIGKSDRVFLSGYFGRDVFGFSGRGVDWGNGTFTLRWNHLFSDRLFSNTSIILSTYDYVFNVGEEDQEININAGIINQILKSDFQYFFHTGNTINFGVELINYQFNPGELNASENSSFNSIHTEKKYGFQSDAYISNEMDITHALKINYGLRYSMYSVLGPGTAYNYGEDGAITGLKSYSDGSLMKRYGQLEPRFNVAYLLDQESSLKFSYSRNSQYIHLLSNSTSGSLIDLWYPSSNNIKPGLADQVALGYFRNFEDNSFETSIEVYYKNLQNQIDYKNGAQIFLNDQLESELIYGRGWSYGFELFVRKNIGYFTGWLGYTWSKTLQQFDQVDKGSPYPARQDRTHDISIAGIYEFNSEWIFSASWVFHTGDAVTYPSGKYSVDGHTVIYYTDRNAARMPAYHRLDLAATWKTSRRTDLVFSVYNTYLRDNAYSISFQENENDPTKTEAVQLTLFSIIPSVTFNFRY